MKRVLITGCTGYIGSHLARELLPDWEVFGLVREPLNLEYLEDVASQIQLLYYDGSYASVDAALKASRPDLVYHLAAYYTGAHGVEQTPKLVHANITLGAYLLEAMSAWRSTALVYASTYMTHYQGAPYRPLNLYAATKQAFSDLLAYYTDAGLLRAATLVLADTYGPGDRRPKVLNLVKQAAQTGEALPFSSGAQMYDLVYIDDVTSAFRTAGNLLLAGRFWNAVFQVVPEAPLSLRETVEKAVQVNGLSLRAEWGKRPSAEREMTGLVRIHPTPPGWRPQVTLEEGLRRMMEG